MPSDEESKTEISEGPGIWYPSVQTFDDLYALAEDGARCRVLSEGATYIHFAGEWLPFDKPRRTNGEK